MTPSDAPSDLEAAAGLLGRPWTMLIIDTLHDGPLRFNEILAHLPGISTNLLSERLRQLQNAAVLTRSTSDSARAVTYQLTRHGKTLSPILRDLATWAASAPNR